MNLLPFWVLFIWGLLVAEKMFGKKRFHIISEMQFSFFTQLSLTQAFGLVVLSIHVVLEIMISENIKKHVLVSSFLNFLATNRVSISLVFHS